MTRPAQTTRHVLTHRRRDENLLDACRHVGQRGPAVAVEFGEHVVEQKHRLDPIGAEQLERTETQRERERPRLTMTRETLGRLVTESQDEVVPVRSDE